MARFAAGTYFLVGIIVTLLGTAAVNAYTLLIAVDVSEPEEAEKEEDDEVAS